MYINRAAETQIRDYLSWFPVTGIIGPRQCGKTTLAKHMLSSITESIYLDLEDERDRLAVTTDPYSFFERYDDRLICLDKVQKTPDIFKVIKSHVDRTGKNGRFLILGSASPSLIKQSSESLAGRIAYCELGPFTWKEVSDQFSMDDLWARGGFPGSLLAVNENASTIWRQNFIRTFLERDVMQLAPNYSSPRIQQLWYMLAHFHGKPLNYSTLAKSMDVSSVTVKNYIHLLQGAFMITLLQPFFRNVKKRIVKSPKLYISDSGILHSLLKIDNLFDLSLHPAYGFSYEGFVIQNLIRSKPGYDPYYYRTSNGAEVDLILSKGKNILAFEIKSSSSPAVSRGFWSAIDTLKPNRSFVVAPVKHPVPLKSEVIMVSLKDYLNNTDL